MNEAPRNTLTEPRHPCALLRDAASRLVLAIVIAGLSTWAAVVSAVDSEPPQSAATPPARADYVGGAACKPCHEAEFTAWSRSHHRLAMQVAEASTVLGNFANAKFNYHGVESTFFRRNGKFFVNTDGVDGKRADYRITYTFGVSPLQQYLITLPDGRVQALGIAWDTRPKAAGGQRWFHLYPNDKVDFRDVLHWTAPAQNWNYMCAECHSTNVRKNYDADTDRFATTRSEVNVSCEACHGPGSKHVEWARLTKDGKAPADRATGFVVDLAARGGSWVLDDSAPIAHLSQPRDTRAQIVCARCHARRAEMSEAYDPSQPLEQTHMLALLDERLYQADGQILDEVFEYGSFLQSVMHARGVTCADCHDPHSGQLRAEGNAACTKCHQPSHYDAPTHHHHTAGTDAARCVQCHMLARTYMVVHTRHDHSFRVPRPDLSVTLGTPNTCSDCHHDHTAQWAADAVVKWYGPTRARGPRYAAALAAGRKHQAGAVRMLGEVIADRSAAPIVRATAVSLLGNFPGATPDLIERSLQDEAPLVRRAAVSLLASWEPQRRWQAGAPLLSDSIRTVRFAAVSALADVPAVVSLTPEQRRTFDRAVAEYRATQAFNADRAEAWLNLGVLDVRLGNAKPAEAAYRRAIRMQPSFMPAYVNLADFYRENQRDADGEAVLRQALAREPGVAEVHHALGLLLVRQKRREEALAELAQAATLDRDSPRYSYVYAVALDSVGQHEKALSILTDAQGRFTGDREILTALVQFSAQAGQAEAVAYWTQQLRALDAAER